MTALISFFSVGGLAALLGAVAALFAAHYSRKQTEASLKVANKQILAPMRQQWIENLRDSIAELISEANNTQQPFLITEASVRAHEESRKRLIFLEQKIRLLVNTAEEDHSTLLMEIRKLITVSHASNSADVATSNAIQSVTEVARRIFKSEWNRIKAEL